MWGDMGRCGERWGDMGRCGEMWGDMGRYGVPRPGTYRTTHGPEPTLGSVLWRYGTRRVPRRAHLRSESGMRGGAARGAGWDSGGDSGVDARQEMTATLERHTQTHELTRLSAGSAVAHLDHTTRCTRAAGSLASEIGPRRTPLPVGALGGGRRGRARVTRETAISAFREGGGRPAVASA